MEGEAAGDGSWSEGRMGEEVDYTRTNEMELLMGENRGEGEMLKRGRYEKKGEQV